MGNLITVSQWHPNRYVNVILPDISSIVDCCYSSCYLCKLNHPSTSKLKMIEIFLPPSTQYSIYIRYIAGETMVLLMGSGSWPPFTSKIHKINSLVSSFDKLKWVMVYIAEAHASDSNWPIDNNYMSPKQHTQLQVRAAHRMLFIGTAVDTMNQSINQILNVWNSNNLFWAIKGRVV